MTKLVKNPRKAHAAEIYALNPDITAQEVADKLQMNVRTVVDWKSDPNFVDAVYNRYMVEFGGEIPAVLNAMIREAKSGNVQAGRLILEHSGKLVKNINVTVDSPFEKFMKKVEVADVIDGEIEDVVVTEIINELPEEVLDLTTLPERNIENQNERAKKEKKQVKKTVKSEKKKVKYLDQRKQWYKLKKRAEAVGVEPLPSKRPTKGQRVAWVEEIERRENEKKEQERA
tara:strand:- start:538 stop:1224 length:687 start_codon:yes stop_codon:yes gene_type:complete